jgi:thioredoxin-related protein
MRLRHALLVFLLPVLTQHLTSCRIIDDHLYSGSTPASRKNTGNSIHSEEKYEALTSRERDNPSLLDSEGAEKKPGARGFGEPIEEELPYDLVQAPRPQSQQAVSRSNLPPGQEFWNVDIEVALREAKDKSLPLLLYFCGSDWSDDCKKIDQKVFASRTFGKFAVTEVVPVRIDFPRTISFTAVHTAQNKRLKEHYDVRTLPTIVLLQADGNYIARLGYEDLPPQQFVETFRRLIMMGPSF